MHAIMLVKLKLFFDATRKKAYFLCFKNIFTIKVLPKRARKLKKIIKVNYLLRFKLTLTLFFICLILDQCLKFLL